MEKLDHNRALIEFNLFKHFRWYDYLIVSAVLFIGSTVIGLIYVYHASNVESHREKRRKIHSAQFEDESSSGASTSFNSHSQSHTTTEQPSKGDGSGSLLSPIVVAVALFSSLISGDLILNNTDEMFHYKIESLFGVVAFLFIGLNLGYFYLPVFYNLKLSSAFEYLQIRFSRTTRVVISLLSIIQSICFLTIVTHGTANGFRLILNPELNKVILCGVLLFIATFTCLLGGLKSMLCTNLLYAFVTLGTLVTVIVLGVIELGGFEGIWERNLNSGRLDVFKIEPDPRTWSTTWTYVFAQYFSYIALLVSTNCTAQRLISMKSLRQARISLTVFIIMAIVFILLCFMVGLLIAAKYFDCDPRSPDTNGVHGFMLPTFVMETFSKFPGVNGLWLTAIVCASISVLSNVLHGLGMTLVSDYVHYYFRDMSENIMHALLKIFIFKFGCIVFGIILFLDLYQEYVPVLSQIFGALIGIVFGVLTLGTFFPWANSKGTLLGVLAALSAMGVLTWASQDFAMRNGLGPTYELPVGNMSCQPLLEIVTRPWNRTHYEFSQNTSSVIIPDAHAHEFNFNLSHSQPLPSPLPLHNESQPDVNSKTESDLMIYVLTISHIWYSTISFLITVLSGLLFSVMLLRWTKKWKVTQECLSPPMLRLWVKLFPTHMKSWIQPEDDLLFLCSNAYPYTPKDRRRRRKHDKNESWCEVHIKPLR